MARSDARSSSLRRRSSRTVPATVLGALIVVAGVAGTWAAVTKLQTGAWPTWVGATHAWLAGQTWGSVPVLVLGGLVALVGLALLVTALRPGPPSAYELEPGDRPALTGGTEYVMTRRSVAKLATATARVVPGVDGVSAQVTTRRVSLDVTSPSTQAGQLQGEVTREVQEALTAAGLHPAPTVRTTVRTVAP